MEAELLKNAEDWIEQYCQFWEQRFDRLNDYLQELQVEEKREEKRSQESEIDCACSTLRRNKMVQQNLTTDTQADCTIVITRVFNAPRELVFKAWTELQQIEQWWGPKGFTTRVTEFDFRSGGQWRYVMVGSDGTEYPVKGVFHEVLPLERIVTSDEFDEGFDQIAKAERPQGIVVTATFEELDVKTKLTLQIGHESADDRRKHEEMGVIGGWNSSFDCLDEYLIGVAD